MPDTQNQAIISRFVKKGTIRLVLSDLYREDAIGNFVLALKDLFAAQAVPCAIYSERSGKDIEINGTYDDLLADVCQDDILFYQLSNIDSRFDELLSVNCRKLFYYHNITPGHYFAPYLPEVAKKLNLGREQFKQLNRVQAILANSEYSLREVAPFVSDEAYLNVVPPVTAKIVKRLQPETKPTFPNFLPTGTRYLIMVGRIVPHKRYEDAVDIFEHLTELMPSLHLVMVGSWCIPYVKQLRAKLSKSKVTKDHIHITGQLPIKELQSAMHYSSGLLCTSRHEGFGVPVLEAMGTGLPVLAHDHPAIKELLGDTGFLFDSENPNKAAVAITAILNDRLTCIKIIQAQKERYQKIMQKADGTKIFRALANILKA